MQLNIQYRYSATALRKRLVNIKVWYGYKFVKFLLMEQKSHDKMGPLARKLQSQKCSEAEAQGKFRESVMTYVFEFLKTYPSEKLVK